MSALPFSLPFLGIALLLLVWAAAMVLTELRRF